jgi:hypothetical protein
MGARATRWRRRRRTKSKTTGNKNKLETPKKKRNSSFADRMIVQDLIAIINKNLPADRDDDDDDKRMLWRVRKKFKINFELTGGSVALQIGNHLEHAESKR